MRLILGLVGVFCVVGANAGCVSIVDDKQRLSCFDQLALCHSVRLDSARLACYQEGGPQGSIAQADSMSSSLPASTETVAVTRAEVEAAYPAPRSPIPVEEETPEIHSSIVAMQKDARGYYYLTLANGHVWREKASVRNRYKEGDQIIISKGALDSNQLRVVGKGRLVRVERYK